MKILNPLKMKRTLDYLKTTDPDLPTLALINNFSETKNLWDTNGLFQIISNETKRAYLIAELSSFAEQNGFEGINIDFEELDEKTYPYYLTFLEELTSELHKSGKTVSVNIPLSNDLFDLREIGDRVDLIFLMAYDEHWSSAEPGAIASQDWFIDGIMNAVTEVPKEKLVVTLGNYGYDWTIGKKQSTAMTFQEAHTTMRESQENIYFDTGSMNPMYSYSDDAGKDHEVWYLDAITAHNQMSAMSELGLGNVSLWRLGSEDPSLWDALHDEKNTDILKKMSYGYDIDYEGSGEFYKLQSDPKIGTRTLINS